MRGLIKRISAMLVVAMSVMGTGSAVAREGVKVISVTPSGADDTRRLQEAIDSAATAGGEPVVIALKPGRYNLSRSEASRHLYHISNTSSAVENPDRTKHIGLWFRNMRNITLDGRGASLVTHGEMTAFAVDSCSDVILKNFTLTAADPSVAEFRVLTVEPAAYTFAVTAPSRFEIDKDGNFSWVGEGWRFADGSGRLPEYAQVFYPDRNITLRCPSPMSGRTKATLIGTDTVRMEFDRTPEVHPGEIYQMRHGIRNEVCGFINMSRDITLDNIDFNFMGNFGLVGQFSENLTYNNIRCCPRPGSGRTNAGFADFVQMSGCSGKVRILGSHFYGAQDDPINIHGTHLKITAIDTPGRTVTTRFMHPQTYGFTPFLEGDDIEIVDVHSLRGLALAKVVSVSRLNDYEYSLTLDRELPEGLNTSDFAIENVTRTPEVEIRDCYFARTPTRGILITTRRKSIIEGNTFVRIPMAAILVSDDALSWFESGPVKDLTIRDNDFIDCAEPVISVWPENDRDDGPVHSNITIEDNRFIIPHDSKATINSLIRHRSTYPIKITGNTITSLL